MALRCSFKDDLGFGGMMEMVVRFVKCAEADNVDGGDDGRCVCQW